MGRKAKYTAAQKIAACEAYLKNQKSVAQIAQELSMSKRSHSTIYLWVSMYQKNGPAILLETQHNSKITKAQKLEAVEMYLGGASLIEVCSTYGIRSASTLCKWISKYNSYKELEDYIPHPEVYMANRKKTTVEERKEIVQYCIDHDLNYSETALKYDCSYAQVYQWVRKYQQNGSESLVDKRGHKKEPKELTELEKAQRRIKQLEHENLLKDREIELLKKLEKVERRWR